MCIWTVVLHEVRRSGFKLWIATRNIITTDEFTHTETVIQCPMLLKASEDTHLFSKRQHIIVFFQELF